MLFGRFALVPRPIRWCLGLVLGAILLVTLSPSDVMERTPSVWCVICGARGVADFILNVILFLPLGAVLRLAGAWRRTPLLVGFFLSLGIELTQAFIPGRDTTLGDVIANTAGCIAGFLLLGVALSLLRPPHRRGAMATLGGVLVSLGAIALTGYLLKPNYPDTAYYGQWTADLDGGLDWYRGHVLGATLATTPMPSSRLEDQATVHALLARGAPLVVTAVAGPAPKRTAPIFSIYDDQRREILLLGPRGNDLVLRYRTHGLAWYLDQPYLTVPGGFAGLAPGEVMNLALWREHGRYCVMRDALRTCDLGFTAGAGWSILIYPPSFSPWVRALLGAAWVGGMLLVVGFAAPTRGVLIAGAGVMTVGLAVLPGMVGLLPTTGLEWVGAVVGIGAGLLTRGILRNSLASSTERR